MLLLRNNITVMLPDIISTVVPFNEATCAKT